MTQNTNQKFCMHCGAKLSPRSKFCHICGNPTLSKPTQPKQEKNRSEVPSMADLADGIKNLAKDVKSSIPELDSVTSFESLSKLKKKMFFETVNSEDAKKSIEVPEKYKKYAESIRNLNIRNPDELLDDLKVENFADKIEELSKINTDINRAEFLYLRGYGLMYQNQFMAALEHFEEALQYNPMKEELWINKGDLLVEMNRLVEAIECYDMAINLNPGQDAAYSMKGRALMRLNKTDDALISLNMALALNPNLALAWMNKGNAMQSPLDYIKRYLCYEKAIEVNPMIASPWLNKGQFLLEFEIDLELAIECFEKTLERSQAPYQSQAALENKGVAIARMGNYAEALQIFDEVLLKFPNSLLSLVNKGVALSKLKKYDEALKYIDKALEINPNYEIAIENRKQILLESRGMAPPQIRNYETNIEDILPKDSSPAFQNFTKSFFRLMDLQEIVLKIENGNREGSLFKRLNELFGPIEGVSSKEKAEFLEELGNITPGVKLIWNLLEEIYTELDDLNSQNKVIKKLIDINPTDDSYYNKFGVNLCIQGNLREGVDKYQEALNLNPYNYDALINLSLCYEILGNKQKAIETLNSLLKLDPKNSKAQERLHNLNNNNSKIFNRAELIDVDTLKSLFKKG